MNAPKTPEERRQHEADSLEHAALSAIDRLFNEGERNRLIDIDEYVAKLIEGHHGKD